MDLGEGWIRFGEELTPSGTAKESCIRSGTGRAETPLRISQIAVLVSLVTARIGHLINKYMIIMDLIGDGKKLCFLQSLGIRSGLNEEREYRCRL